METKHAPERWHQIATAVFDRYVMKRMIEVSFVVTEDGIDDQDLCNFAKQVNCDPGLLRAAIVNSCSRMTRECLTIPISTENEKAVMIAAIKQNLREISVSLLNLKREMGKVTQELNHKSIWPHITTPELKKFIGPLHAEVVTEFYEL